MNAHLLKTYTVWDGNVSIAATLLILYQSLLKQAAT